MTQIKKVLNMINVKDYIDNYLTSYRIFGDTGVNTQASGAIVFHIEKTLNLYKNYYSLYDEQYTTDWIEYCLINYIPEMMMCVTKNAVGVSKIFSNFKDIQEKNITESVNKNSYEGFNAAGVFNRNDNLVTQHLYNPLRTLLLMDVDFKDVTLNFKRNLEKILRIYY